MTTTSEAGTTRLQIRLKPDEFRRVSERAAARDQTPHDYARDRALRRLRPSAAQRLLAEESPACLERLLHYLRTAAKLGVHIAPTLPHGSEHRRAAEMLDEAFDVAEADLETLRRLIRDAVIP